MGHDAGLNNLGTIKEVKKKENISCIHLLNPIPIQNVAVFYQRKPPCVWQQRWNIQDIVSVYLQWAIVCALFVLRVCFLSSLDINHAPSQEWASSDDFNSWIVEFGISAEREDRALLRGPGLGFYTEASVTFHPFVCWRDWTAQASRRCGAFLRRSAGLYLASSGCVVLIFMWPFLRTCLKKMRKTPRRNSLVLTYQTEHVLICQLIRCNLAFVGCRNWLLVAHHWPPLDPSLPNDQY